MINSMGSNNMPRFFTLKGKVDARLNKIPYLVDHLTDRVMQGFSRILPNHLPKRIKTYRNQYEHHLLLKCQVMVLPKRNNIYAPFCYCGR